MWNSNQNMETSRPDGIAGLAENKSRREEIAPDCRLNKCTTELGMQIRIKEV